MNSSTNYYIFFDDGGVLNDNNQRSLKWKKLVAEWFSPRFGGKTEEWKKANELAVLEEMKHFEQIFKTNPHVDPSSFELKMNYHWLETMFDSVGLPMPPPDDIQKIVQESFEWITPRAHAPYDGIIDAIHEIASLFGPLHTASNENSKTIERYLRGMGVKHHFKHFFGANLIGQYKTSKQYYRRIFDILGITPKQAIIVEDSPKNIQFIQEVGAIPIQSALSTGHEIVADHVLQKADNLPHILQSIIR